MMNSLEFTRVYFSKLSVDLGAFVQRAFILVFFFLHVLVMFGNIFFFPRFYGEVVINGLLCVCVGEVPLGTAPC